MDAASDAPLIRSHSESLGHVALIDENPRTKEGKAVPHTVMNTAYYQMSTGLFGLKSQKREYLGNWSKIAQS
jgi:hypothetical protein